MSGSLMYMHACITEFKPKPNLALAGIGLARAVTITAKILKLTTKMHLINTLDHI